MAKLKYYSNVSRGKRLKQEGDDKVPSRATATLPVAKVPQPTTELTIRLSAAEQMLQFRMTLRTPGACTPFR